VTAGFAAAAAAEDAATPRMETVFPLPAARPLAFAAPAAEREAEEEVAAAPPAPLPLTSFCPCACGFASNSDMVAGKVGSGISPIPIPTPSSSANASKSSSFKSEVVSHISAISIWSASFGISGGIGACAGTVDEAEFAPVPAAEVDGTDSVVVWELSSVPCVPEPEEGTTLPFAFRFAGVTPAPVFRPASPAGFEPAPAAVKPPPPAFVLPSSA